MNYPFALLQFVFLFLSDLVMDAAGLFVVAIAIPFRIESTSIDDGRPILNLPKWAYPWGNDFDGLLGDKRGWWTANAPFPFHTFLGMYWWAAIRNPANNMRMFSLWNAPIQGSRIEWRGDFTVADKPFMGGMQLVKLTNPSLRLPRYGFYWVHQWTPTHATVLRLGYKISPDLQGTLELPKGETTRFNPWKSIV
jgi:hypothetical protein